MFDRNTLLKDLRNNVIELTFQAIDGTNPMGRFSLRPKNLPKSYDINEEKKFHDTNPTIIQTWNMNTNTWYMFDIKDVVNIEDVSEHY